MAMYTKSRMTCCRSPLWLPMVLITLPVAGRWQAEQGRQHAVMSVLYPRGPRARWNAWGGALPMMTVNSGRAAPCTSAPAVPSRSRRASVRSAKLPRATQRWCQCAGRPPCCRCAAGTVRTPEQAPVLHGSLRLTPACCARQVAVVHSLQSGHFGSRRHAAADARCSSALRLDGAACCVALLKHCTTPTQERPGLQGCLVHTRNGDRTSAYVAMYECREISHGGSVWVCNSSMPLSCMTGTSIFILWGR
jgi:hypothetical protein